MEQMRGCTMAPPFSHYAYSASALEMMKQKTKQTALANETYSREIATLAMAPGDGTSSRHRVAFSAEVAAQIAKGAVPCPDSSTLQHLGQ